MGVHREYVYEQLRTRDYHAYIDALEYIEEHQEDFFNNDLDLADLPLTPGERVALKIGIMYGVSWEADSRRGAESVPVSQR